MCITAGVLLLGFRIIVAVDNKKNKHKFDSLFLWSGRSYNIDKGLCVKHPKVSDILDLGQTCETEYLYMLNVLASNVFEQKAMLWEMGIDYEKVTDYNIFLQQMYSACVMEEKNMIKSNVYTKALSFFLGNETSSFCITDKYKGLSIIDTSNPDFILNEESFYKVQSFLRTIHYWSEEEPGKPANEKVKKIMIELELEKIKALSKDVDDGIGNLVSSIVEIDTDIENVPIYRLFNKFRRQQKVIDYKLVMAGFYAGTLKLTPSEKESLLWCGKLT